MIKTESKNILALSLEELREHAYKLEAELIEKDAELERLCFKIADEGLY